MYGSTVRVRHGLPFPTSSLRPMKLRRKVRQIPEALLVLLGFILVPWLPRQWVVLLADGLGTAGFCLSAGQRKIALANLDVAFGDELTRTEKESIARESFRTFALVVLDLFWFSAFSKSRISRYVEIDSSFDIYRRASPVVAVTGHFGNWEVMGLAAALDGNPNVSVATPLKNRLVDKMLNRFRRGTGQEIQMRNGAVRGMIRVLKEGGRTALLMDQNTLPEEGGEFVGFFGLPVPVTRVAALLAKRTGSATVLTYCVLRSQGHYTVYAASLSEEEDGVGMTQLATTALEDKIREYPGQWLWSYKRWKHVPDDESIDSYPFYAKKGKL